MKNYQRLYEDVYFYSTEYERALAEVKRIKKNGESEGALLRAEREAARLKEKLDKLASELPEERE